MSDQELTETVKSEYKRLLEEGRLAEALPMIRQAANWADLDSQILAERIYMHGLYDHAIDIRSGMDYALLAAMNGDGQSMLDLGLVYKKGYGSKPDLEKANYWLKKAADLGFTEETQDQK